MPNQTEAWTPDPETVAALRTWLGDDGLSFFRECQTDHGRVDPVIFQDVGNRAGMTVKAIPHSVHFREGMQGRNFLRGSYCGLMLGSGVIRNSTPIP